MRTCILALTLAFSVFAPNAHAQAVGAPTAGAFVDAHQVIPDLVVEMRYAGHENFVGRPIAGYLAPVCMLTREATAALAAVQAQLAPFGLGLKVYDCFRPARAVADFGRWARDPADLARKAEYYPNVDKSELFARGYIAARSGHSRGSTVDLTVVDAVTKAELDMGSPYDLFDTKSWPADQTVGPVYRANRLMLQAVMRAHGFDAIKEEWWHFKLHGEPYPQTYFDFPVGG